MLDDKILITLWNLESLFLGRAFSKTEPPLYDYFDWQKY